jgi:hypothetical protein
MITPILTYGSEIWIADHKINIENLHNLSFEKTQNMIMKQMCNCLSSSKADLSKSYT